MSDNIYNYYRIEKAISYLSDHFKTQPDLEELAGKVHVSPFHFQRMFTNWVGISPKKFLQYLTLDYLRDKIRETENMMEAAEIAGLSSQSRVHELFVSIEGVTPNQFKTSGEGLDIFYGYHASPFGVCFIAVTERGVCCLKFVDEEKKRLEFDSFASQWHFAKLIHKPELTQEYIRKIFNPNRDYAENLNLLVQGTPFQLKVWEALVQIPFGNVYSYKQVAEKAGCPQAYRSVGTAIGQNTVLYLIPCHRVIAGDGSMGNYNYGRARKMTMLGWEISHKEILQ